MILTQSRAFILLRYTLIVATAYLVLAEDGFGPPDRGVMLIIAAALASNLAAGFLPTSLLTSFPLRAAVILGDTIWITAVLFISGLFSPDFFYVYFFVLLLAAVCENLALTAAAAALLCGLYLYGNLGSGWTWMRWTAPSLIRLPFLFAAAIFYGYLIDSVRRERRRGDINEGVTRQLERMLDELRRKHAKSGEADRIRAAFLAAVSQELRTPLRSIVSRLTPVLEGSHGPLTLEQREALSRIEESSANLYRAIGSLLDANRLDLGGETVDRRECNLAALLVDLRNDYPGSRSVRIYYPRIIDAPPIFTDEAKLRKVLTHLVDNAVKFTEHGVVTVDLRWDARRDRVEFRIADTGPGIPEDELDRVFEAFRQGAEPEDAVHGMGLGLYVVRKLVELLGGEIAVASKIGEGSTFTVTLPRDVYYGRTETAAIGSTATH